MALIRELTALLSENRNEIQYQRWIENNPTALGGDSTVFSEVQLGSEYRLDFVSVKTNTAGLNWKVFEIKRPDAKIFKASGRFTSSASDAIHQVENYQSWIAENLDYARKILPDIYTPRFSIIIGRRDELDEKHRLFLRHFNANSRTQIRTFDFLVENILNFGGINDLYMARARGVMNRIPEAKHRVCPPHLRS